MILLFLALAQTTAPATPGVGGGLGGFIVPMTLMLVIMYFLMIRPQRKRAADQQRLIASMKTGDKVVTSAPWPARTRPASSLAPPPPCLAPPAPAALAATDRSGPARKSPAPAVRGRPHSPAALR